MAKQLHILSTRAREVALEGVFVEVYPLRPVDGNPASRVRRALARWAKRDLPTFISYHHQVFHLPIDGWSGVVWDGRRPLGVHPFACELVGELHRLRDGWTIIPQLPRIRDVASAAAGELESLGYNTADNRFLDAVYYTTLSPDPRGLLRAMEGAIDCLEEWGIIVDSNLIQNLSCCCEILRSYGIRKSPRTCILCWGRKAITDPESLSTGSYVREYVINACPACSPAVSSQRDVP